MASSNSDHEEQLASLDSQLFTILHESQQEGMTEQELRQLFSPLILHISSLSATNASPKNPKSKSWLSSIFILTIIIMLLLGGIILGPSMSSTSTSSSTSSSLIGSFGSSLTNVKNAIGTKLLVFARLFLVKILPYWNWTDLYYSRCLVKNPFYQDNVLHVDDCNMCETLDEIDHVSNISQSRVIEEYIKREKPFIVTDAMADWSVMKTDHFWFDNITELFLSQDSYFVCNLNTNLRTSASAAAEARSTTSDLAKIIRKLYNPHTQQWFLHWENCQKEGAKVTRQFYRRPYFISNSLDFTGSNWVLMSSDFHGRVFKKLEVRESLSMMYQLRGSNHIRLIPKEICRDHCPELTITLHEGEILVVTHFLWILEYIPGELGDNLSILSEVSWSASD